MKQRSAARVLLFRSLVSQRRSFASKSNTSKQAKNAHELANTVTSVLGLTDKASWFKVTQGQVLHSGGPQAERVLQAANYSMPRFLRLAYPDHQWDDWLFTPTPRMSHSMWKSVSTQRRFLEWVQTQEKMDSLAGFYALSPVTLRKYGGQSLYKRHNYNTLEMLTTAFPEHPWIPWKFKKVRPSFWQTTANQKAYFDWVAGELKIASFSDWYGILPAQVMALHGGGLLRSKFDNSLYAALTTVYPDHRWYQWKFPNTHKRFVAPQHLREYFDEAKSLVDVHNLSDWYSVTMEMIIQAQNREISAVTGIFGRSLYDALRAAYPEHNWNKEMFQRSRNHQTDE